MATSPSTLAANSVCVQRCIPDGLKLAALIKLFADVANKPTDAAGINDLILESRCINQCIPAGLQMAALVAILNRVTGAAPTPVCVNLIPDGATYGGFGSFDLSTLLNAGTTYQITFGQNEVALNNSGGVPPGILPPGTFTFTTPSPITIAQRLDGNPFALVTATICEV